MVVLSAPTKTFPGFIATATFDMKADLLLRQTRMHFPRFALDEIKINPIEKGGSGRKFYRVQCSAEQTLILVKYDLERDENRHYVEIARFLEAHKIRAPKIYFHDPDEGLIWLEDLGECDLFGYRHDTWMVRRAFYESALDEISKLHRLPKVVCLEMREKLPVEFNAALYRWEQNYFFENCLDRYFRIDKQEVASLASLPKLNQIAQHLEELPRVLVHRDFQSQNIIVRNSGAYLIDFQGMRPGLAEYDVASLLYDPYVALADVERAELVEHYCGGAPSKSFSETLRLCAMQRLMQALGAYGFLGLVKGHKQFLNHIPAALKSLSETVSTITGLEEIVETISRLADERVR